MCVASKRASRKHGVNSQHSHTLHPEVVVETDEIAQSVLFLDGQELFTPCLDQVEALAVRLGCIAIGFLVQILPTPTNAQE